MSYTLDLLKQLVDDLAGQFGPDCEIVIHDLKKYDLKHSIVHISNGHVANRQEGDRPSEVTLETLRKDPTSLKNHLGYLARISNDKILKSSIIYIRNKGEGPIDYLPSINYNVAGLMIVDRSIKAPISTKPQGDIKQRPKQIVHNISSLLGTLIEQSVALIGKPVILASKEERATAVQFLDDASAFFITKSGDKVLKYFGTSKFTLYNYIDTNSRKSNDKKA